MKDNIELTVRRFCDDLVLSDDYNLLVLKEMKASLDGIQDLIKLYLKMGDNYINSKNREYRIKLLSEIKEIRKKYDELSEEFTRKIAFIDEFELTTFGDFDKYIYFDNKLKTMTYDTIKNIINDSYEFSKILDRRITEVEYIARTYKDQIISEYLAEFRYA